MNLPHISEQTLSTATELDSARQYLTDGAIVLSEPVDAIIISVNLRDRLSRFTNLTSSHAIKPGNPRCCPAMRIGVELGIRQH